MPDIFFQFLSEKSQIGSTLSAAINAIKLRDLLPALFTLLVITGLPLHAEDNPAPEVARPKVIFFDVNETLLDMKNRQDSVAKILDGKKELIPLWFSTMLHYSLVDTTTGRYHGFAEIGVAALQMVAKNNGIELSEEEARKAIVTPLRSLTSHPDVKEGLQSLKDQGFRLISFTNSSHKRVKTQFENAGLIDFFEVRLSGEDKEVYKPAPLGDGESGSEARGMHDGCGPWLGHRGHQGLWNERRLRHPSRQDALSLGDTC